jgi:hypothetical protein
MFLNAILQIVTEMGARYIINIPQRSIPREHCKLNTHTGLCVEAGVELGLYHYHCTVSHLLEILFDINFVTCREKFNPSKHCVENAPQLFK